MEKPITGNGTVEAREVALSGSRVRDSTMHLRTWILAILSAALTLLNAQATDATNLANQLTKFAPSSLRVSGIAREDFKVTEWRKEVAAAKLESEVMKALKPSDPKHSSAWATYALACEILGQTDEATKAYEHVLTLRRTHAGARLRLYLLSDTDEDAELLDPLKLAEFTLAGQILASRWHDKKDAASLLKIERFLTKAHASKRHKANLAWALGLICRLEKDELESMAHTMIPIPSLSLEGYSYWRGLKNTEDLLGVSRMALEAQAKAARSFRSHAYGHPAPSMIYSPASILLAEAYRHQDEADLPEIPKDLYALYFGPEEDFLNHALALVDRRNLKRSRSHLDLRLQEVVDAWHTRQLKLDLTPVFTQQFPQWSTPSEPIPQALQEYATHVEDLPAWLDSLAEHASNDEALFHRLLQSLSFKDSLFWPVMHYIDGRRKGEASISLAAHPLLQSSNYEDLTLISKELRSSPFLADLETFRSFPRKQGQSSFFADIILRLRQLPVPRQNAYTVMLNGYPESFGRDFLIATISKEPSKAASDLLEQHRDAILALPPQRKRDLQAEVKRLFPDASISWFTSDGDAVDRTAIDAFLATETFADLGWTAPQLQSRSREWIRALAQAEPTLAKRIFHKAATLQPAEAGDASTLLHRALQGTPSLHVALLGADLIGDPTSNDSLARIDAFPYASALLETLDPGEEDWEKSLNHFFREMTKQPLPDHSLPVLIDGLVKVTEGLGNRDLKQMSRLASWLEHDLFSGKHPALARTCFLLMELQRASLDTEEEEDIDTAPIWSELSDMLDQDDVSLSGRVALAESFCVHFDQQLPDDTVASILNLAAEAVSGGALAEKQLSILAATAIEKPEIARDKKAALAKAWESTGDSGSARQRLQLALQGGENEVATQITTAHADEIDFNWLALLLSEGATDQAVKLLREDWKRFDWLHGIRTGRQANYESSFGKSLEALRQALETDAPDHALLAEALISGLPDASEEEGNPRGARMVTLAERLTKHEWRDVVMEQTVLSYLGLELKAARSLKERYVSHQDKIDLNDLHGLTNIRDRRCHQRLLPLAARFGLHTGPESFRTPLEALIRIPDVDVKAFLQPLLLNTLAQAFKEDWASWDSEAFQANLELLPLAEDLDPTHWLPLAWAMRTLADSPNGVAIPARIRRAKADPESEQTPVQQFVDEALEHLQTALKASALEEADRIDAALRLSKHPGFLRGLKHNDTLFQGWFSYLRRYEIMPMERLMEEAHDLAKAAPRDGWAWVEGARIHERADKGVDALPFWNEAVGFAGDDPLRYSTFNLGRLQQLLNLKMLKEADQLIKGFDEKRLHPDFKELWKQLKKPPIPRANSKAPVV